MTRETCQRINHRCLEEIKKKVEADFNYFHDKSEGCNLNSLLVCDKAHQRFIFNGQRISRQNILVILSPRVYAIFPVVRTRRFELKM